MRLGDEQSHDDDDDEEEDEDSAAKIIFPPGVNVIKLFTAVSYEFS
jgi:hypothetical protein